MLLGAIAVFGQADRGELRINVKDPSGLALKGRVEVVSQANQYVREFDTDADGHVTAKRLPFGLYTVRASRQDFAPASQLVDLRSAIPIELTLVLGIGQVNTTVTVNSDATLIDPGDVSSANRIGAATLQDRLTAQPGRSLGELVNQDPGWLFEANGVLHPRGEEYQTQYVVDGIPLTDNRSVAYVPDFDANSVQEMSVYTAGFPAEYGRKMGGVIEVETQRDTRQGFHGNAVLSGGSFDTENAYLEGQYGWNTNTFTLSASATSTGRYLDPPVLQNYTNHGTLADFMAHYERDLTEKDRIGVILRREQSKFLVPNEILQQQAGQRQDRDSFESAGQFSYEHIFSPNVLGDFRAMVRDITAGFWSNDLSTPMIASQDRGYHEEYVKGTVSVHAGMHEFKTGIESDYASIQEALSYLITDPAQFDPDTPPSFSFYGHAADREQGIFAQDEMHWKNLTLSGGLRFDHYDLLVNQVGWSPRAGAAVYWPWAKIIFRASYDRIFQTPPFENLLVSSSPAVTTLSDQVLRLPVQPARGNYYQTGFGRAIFGKVRFNGNFFWRSYHNYPDDDLLLNTGVSFPITFARADIYGAEAKLEVRKWGPFSGYASYSNMRGNGYFPVTGGLFIGDDAAQAISATSGVFPVSQDQRNTVRARVRYDINPRVWTAIGGTYDTGLPIDFDGTYQQAALEYGQAILNRVNFSDYRPRPLFSLDASLGVVMSKSEKHPVRLQIDGTNLTNEINVIDFAGLFSGTAIGISRSVDARLQFGF
ncbi:MAG TPA: TonB-dependent receptor [Bryobacteraceae bacterium]|nr:TonB-dependent receptor [Bryobacteraceae bacterium]